MRLWQFDPSFKLSLLGTCECPLILPKSPRLNAKSKRAQHLGLGSVDAAAPCVRRYVSGVNRRTNVVKPHPPPFPKVRLEILVCLEQNEKKKKRMIVGFNGSNLSHSRSIAPMSPSTADITGCRSSG
jgi:hypothetical protein